MSSQINLHVSSQFWQALYGRTELWPERTVAAICRYALLELYVVKCIEKPKGLRLPRRGPDKGAKRVQVMTTCAEEVDQWKALGSVYGSTPAALAIALQFLHDSLSHDPEDDEVADSPGVTSAEVARVRKQRAVGSDRR